MDRRRASILARSLLQYGFDRVLQKIWSGLAWHTSRVGYVWHFRSGYDSTESWFWRRMERCRRRHSMDFVESDRRQIDHRRKLARDGKVSRGHRERQSGLFVEEELRYPLLVLAFPGRPPSSGHRCH